ncbi:CLUMA_CG009449, isoform A [Clunio marinus]|uniref:CLUMA_CG009449, isoform A n=1 Tax=Clunio marinus TaxID=568069 RepID=A0A1J1IC46_9DIPT|nr:CLUMA_CG009449, isoform A [Clunio marinus]
MTLPFFRGFSTTNQTNAGQQLPTNECQPISEKHSTKQSVMRSEERQELDDEIIRKTEIENNPTKFLTNLYRLKSNSPTFEEEFNKNLQASTVNPIKRLIAVEID